MAAVQQGQLTRVAAERYGIPRRTLAYHMKTGSIVKRLGRGSIMNAGQEIGLVNKIMKLLSDGIPLSPNLICRQAFLFCEKYKINHNFNSEIGLAGKEWLMGFLKRHPEFVMDDEDF